MVQDYQGNSQKDKQPKPEKNIEKVISGEVIVKKKPLGRKIRDTIVEADFKSVVRYVWSDVLIPAAKNMIVDSVYSGINRAVYKGDSRGRYSQRPGYTSYGSGPRVSYPNSPLRGYSDSASRHQAPPITVGSRDRYIQDDIILTDRGDAERMVEALREAVDKFDVISVGDMNQMIGRPTTPSDFKWGWVFLGDVQIRQIRDGYLIDIPLPEPI